MNITVYLRDNYIKKDGMAPVYLQMFIMKRKVTVSTGVYIIPLDWDSEKKIIKSRNENANDYNLLIKLAIGKANDIFIKYRLMGREITPDQFRYEFKNPSVYIDFYEWMENEITERKEAEICEGTAIHHYSVLNRELRGFRKKLTFSEIDKNFVDKYVRFVKKRHKNDNTRYRKIQVFKTYVRIALTRDLIKSDPFTDVKLKKGKTNQEYLEESELYQLLELYKSGKLKDNEHKILRHFLFACLTGLRISDLKRLKHENIVNGTIVIYPYKTKRVKKELVKIPLSRSADKLIKDEDSKRIYGFVFITFADQTINKYLKLIARIAGIEKKITTKVARHTFANLFLRHNPGDIATLKELMGHAKLEQTLVYLHITEDWKRSRMKIFDKYYSIIN